MVAGISSFFMANRLIGLIFGQGSYIIMWCCLRWWDLRGFIDAAWSARCASFMAWKELGPRWGQQRRGSSMEIIQMASNNQPMDGWPPNYTQ
jgi:hypothetical protein